MVDIGERVVHLRRRAKLTQRQLAELCDRIDKRRVWPQSKICRIENGRLGVSAVDLDIIARALDITVPALWGRS